MSENLSSEQIEIIQEFIQECTELIDQLEPSIIELGSDIRSDGFVLDDENKQVLNEIFRLFHSLKGSAAFLNFNLLSSTAHAAENLLDQIRNESIKMIPDHVDLFCSTCDFARESLDYVGENFNDEGMADQAQEISNKLKVAIGAVEEPAVKPEQSEEESSQPVTEAAEAIEEEPESSPSDEELDFELTITPEMVQKFVEEGDEQLQEVEEGLLKWANEPDDMEPVSELFRQIHSFKGNCGFLGYADLEKLSHQMETVLDAVKSGADMGKAKPADTLLNLIDELKGALADISQGGKGQIDGLDLYIELLQGILPEDWVSPVKSAAPNRAPKLGEVLVEKGVITDETLEAALDLQKKPIGEVLVDMGAASPDEVNEALQEQEKVKQEVAKKMPDAKPKPAMAIKRQDIRVDLQKLDSLIDLIGEMVIAENMLIHSPDLEGLELESFGKSAQQMGKLVKELQEVAMTIRMIPVAGLFRRMTRLVHDLSRKSGKQVDLQLEGVETELDKTVIETITDPLVHLIRNSMDHGLEMTDERIQNGKSEIGTLRLGASHEEGEVWITIDDDGRGLNRKKIIQKAITKGLIDGDGSEMSDKEVANMIFLPGFSTADKVTDVSGRGVGMDVVKQNLAKIDGRIDVDTKPGSGTRVKLRIPLTMAIIEGMLTRVGTARYILPIRSIRESFRPNPSAITISPDGLELVRVRDHLYPIFRLHELHNIQSDYKELHDGIVILLEDQKRKICLFVDEILGQQQTVIKGLSDYISKMGNVSGVSGCTILGNGEVCLILDIGALAEITEDKAADER